MRRRFRTTVLTISLLGLSCFFQLVTIFAAPGDLDTTFNGTGKTRVGFGLGGDSGRAVAIQADSKLVVAGLTQDGSPNDFAVIRYNADGSLDDGGPSDTTPNDSFGDGGKVITAISTGDDGGRAVALQADGKIVVVGFSSNGTNAYFAVVRYNTDGTLDTSFSGDGKVTTAIGAGNDQANAVAIADDKIVVAGTSRNGANTDFAVVRYNADGSLDTSFDLDGKVTTPIGTANDLAFAVAIQADSKIVVAGYSYTGSNSDIAVVRYNADGALDSSFDLDGKVTTPIGTGNDFGYAVAIQAGGKIVVAGQSYTGISDDIAVVRYNTDGSLDSSFSGDGKVTTPIGTNFGQAFAVAIQAGGEIVVAGTSFNGTNDDFAVVRYNDNGSLDNSFDGDGKVTTAIGTGNDVGNAVAVQSDGKIVVAGSSLIGTSYDFAVVRYNADGTLDSSFELDGNVTTSIGTGDDYGLAAALQADGKIVVAGFSLIGTNYDFAVVRYNTDGTLDNSFDLDGKVTTSIGTSADIGAAVAIQSDGKIVVAGYSFNGANDDFAVVRYNTDGSLDTSFDGDGKVTTPIGTSTDQGRAVAVQTDGKIVVAGFSNNGANYDFAAVRYNADGTLDTSFDGDGKVTTAIGTGQDFGFAVAIQAGGKIVVAGYAHIGTNDDFAVVRYNTDGTLDPSFDLDGKVTTPIGAGDDAGRAVAIQSDGKIIVAGYARVGANIDFALARYNANGSLDTSFDGDGKVTTPIGTGSDFGIAVAIQSDGKIVVAGYSYTGSNSDVAVVRYNADGTLDTTFDGDGKVTTPIGAGDDFAAQLAIQSDGKIVVAGYSFNGANNDFAVARYNLDGTPDTSLGGDRVFDIDGRRTDDVGNNVAAANDVAIQSDGKIVVAGFSNNGSNNDFAVVRYNANGTLDTSFDLDGKVTTPIGTGSDAGNAVAIQSDGKIVVAGSSFNGSNLDIAVVRYNANGTLDTTFDGDGKVTTDIGTSFDTGDAVAIQSDGKIVVAGYSLIGTTYDIAVARYNANGSLDLSFDLDGKVTTPIGTSFDFCKAVAIQQDGKIVVAGSSTNGPNDDFAVVRYNADGSLDTTFDLDGKVTTDIDTGNDAGIAVALQSDGKIVVAGSSTNGPNDDFAVVRYNADGSLDTTLDLDGKVTTPVGTGNDSGAALALQGDGKIVVAGNSSNGSNDDIAVVRYNTNGSLDTSYGTGGKVVVDVSNGNDSGNGVALDSSDRAVVAGGADGLFGVVRILGDAQPSCNYSLSPASDYVSARGGACSFNVTVGAGCQWTAQTSDTWIVIISDPSGTGNGTVSLEIRDNFTSSARLGTVTVGDQSFTVVQEGRNVSCSYSISPLFASYVVSGGTGSIGLTTSAQCGWRAVSAQSWIVITSTEVGIGSATISYSVSTNTTGAVRDGAIVVGGQSFKVKQKGG